MLAADPAAIMVILKTRHMEQQLMRASMLL
jgi:hypothetical protein